MKAVEKIINGNWYLFIKDNRKMVIKIAKPNDLNFQNWAISLTNGICYTYKEISQYLKDNKNYFAFSLQDGLGAEYLNESIDLIIFIEKLIDKM